ncbi:MAG: AraC family transcriptional regulator [Pseudomonadota bacterium]
MADISIDWERSGTDVGRTVLRKSSADSQQDTRISNGIINRCEKIGDISHEDMADLSRRFDSHYEGSSKAPLRGDSPSFRGNIAAQSFGSGLSMGTSDLVALTDTQQSALVPRSLSIALLIDGDDISARLQGGRAMNLRRSSALAVSLGEPAQMSTEVAAGTAAKTIVVQCNPDMLRDDELCTAVDRLTGSTWVKALSVPARWNLMAAEMLAPQTDGLSQRLMAEGFALDMVSTMLEYLSDRSQSPAKLCVRDKSRLLRVRDMIEADPHADHSLGALAREAGISVATLKRKFPAMFGTSVIAYLRDFRLDKARDGICTQGWTIAEAAHFAGYAHASNFTTAFRRRHGITPGAIASS